MADEVLVVTSKVKKYIKEKSEMNTAGNVAGVISELVRGLCDQAMANAKSDGRKTVKDRDFPSVSSGGDEGGEGGES